MAADRPGCLRSAHRPEPAAAGRRGSVVSPPLVQPERALMTSINRSTRTPANSSCAAGDGLARAGIPRGPIFRPLGWERRYPGFRRPLRRGDDGWRSSSWRISPAAPTASSTTRRRQGVDPGSRASSLAEGPGPLNLSLVLDRICHRHCRIDPASAPDSGFPDQELYLQVFTGQERLLAGSGRPGSGRGSSGPCYRSRPPSLTDRSARSAISSAWKQPGISPFPGTTRNSTSISSPSATARSRGEERLQSSHPQQRHPSGPGHRGCWPTCTTEPGRHNRPSTSIAAVSFSSRGWPWVIPSVRSRGSGGVNKSPKRQSPAITPFGSDIVVSLCGIHRRDQWVQ